MPYESYHNALFKAAASEITNALDDFENNDGWTPGKQDKIANYMGQLIAAWGKITEKSLDDLFRGTDESIKLLTELISDGKFVEGSGQSIGLPPTNPDEPKDTGSALQANIGKAFFAFAIPSSGPFPAGDYLDKDTMLLIKACYHNKRYYLATLDRDPYTCFEGGCLDNAFSALPGNGEMNGGAAADPEDEATLEDLYNDDITTPGFIRLPVCSAKIAYCAWNHGDSPDTDAPNYPGVIYPAPDHCGTLMFVDQTSDASLTVSDCMQIVKNIQNTDGDWEVENAIGNQHQLVQFGSCAFGVQGKGKNGNVDFHIGAQDIVDIITDLVNKFGGSGKVGAKGEMSCKETVKGQKVELGLY
ncbi:uncharacterized protein CDV56_103839 [Aspergillus thermomutatus]|uniref:Ecp2 effector protein-like domain-containing protein n=1 Tax=Aspergillus thermomutatus TaxID=41047 RepID=A0A397HH52_ASPTH|nr:uncharacterized protein CDV56_103839 [Aspergillus thermomutatus]RHZ59790.1 hypothetical protein CDV56_103839 [Aspergillus thermomutatus]